MLLVPSAVGLVATAGMSVAVVLGVGGEVLDVSAPAAGLFVLVLGLLWAALGFGGLVAPRPLALAVGTGLGLTGAQVQLVTEATEARGYALTFGIAIVCFAVYRWYRSVVLLVAGVVGVTLAVPEAIDEWFGGTVGGAAVLLIAGAVLVAASALGLWLRRNTDQPHATAA
jgi:hypothetical protein